MRSVSTDEQGRSGKGFVRDFHNDAHVRVDVRGGDEVGVED